MGTVSVFSIEGLDIYFNSSDHYPPHFHVETGDWEIRVYIDTSSLEKGLDFDYKWPKQVSKKFRGITKKAKTAAVRNDRQSQDRAIRRVAGKG